MMTRGADSVRTDMMTKVFAGAVLGCLLVLVGEARGAGRVEVVNNQPFAVYQPVRIRGINAEVGNADGKRQGVGDDLVILADVGVGQTQNANITGAEGSKWQLVVEADGEGIGMKLNGKDLGTLAWDVVVERVTKTQAEYVSTKRKFNESFKAMPLKFEKSKTGELLDTWTAKGEKDGVALAFEVNAFHAGFLDANVTFTNKSAPTKNVYAAVVCRWEQTAADRHELRTVNYNNEVLPLGAGKSTPFREGTERHLYVMRGTDWIKTPLQGGGTAAWLNDFTPSFTVHKEKTAKQPARWVGANTAQLGQEAQVSKNALYSITEIARPNIKSYRSRLDDNVLPQHGEDPLTISSRLILSSGVMTDEQVDQAFVAMTGYRHQEPTKEGIRYSIGVPYTKFGTNYFPYSTLGENFINLRIPGMSKEGYWPLAPETVNQWKLFADDIKRDLRILKAMGFEISRLHHLELIWDKDPKTNKPYVEEAKRWQYLDFYFGELKALGLKALLDVKLTPAETAELVARYRPQVEGVEIDNEVVLFMIPDGDVQYWKDVYEAVKKVAPEIPVHLTGHTNTGAFARLVKLGVPFDKVGAHAYMDAVEAIPSSRDYGLAVADYASSLNKEPVITEWNWRFLTRMSFEDRAKVYPPIFENVLKTKCMPTMYQFQFQDSLAMNPAGLKGMRRYEQILLSRRPKPEAFEMMKLITKYASPNHPNRQLDVPVLDVEADGEGKAELKFSVTDIGDEILALNARVETPAGVMVESDAQRMTLGPKGTWFVPVKVSLAKDAKPGFYHVFVRIEGPKELLRYGWGIVRKAGPPEMDREVSEKSKVKYEDGALDFDLNRPVTVVYAKDCTPMELESAWTIFITLESATGRVVEIAEDDQEPATVEGRAKIIVKSAKGEAAGGAVKRLGSDELVITGEKPEDVAMAAMDFALRYWKNAKDSAARRVGLTEQSSGKSGVKTDLE